jgi:hypothetical protein
MPDIINRHNRFLAAQYIGRQSELLGLTGLSVLHDGLIVYPVPEELRAIPPFVPDREKWKQYVLLDQKNNVFGTLSMYRIESASRRIALWYPRNIMAPTYEQAKNFFVELDEIALDNRQLDRPCNAVYFTITMTLLAKIRDPKTSTEARENAQQQLDDFFDAGIDSVIKADNLFY